MPGPFLVKKAVALGTTLVTGDGKGSENPVPVAGVNQVVLLIDANPTASTNLDTYMEITINGTDYYRETAAGTNSNGTITMNRKTYRLSGTTDMPTGADSRLAISIPVLARFARFSFLASVAMNNFACRAITGRV